ncbi:S9 family peptidase [Puteibacter caeruleilacunae]|nr:S9 family peptidase [Puteibacter caeruleilacunae]
MFLFLKGIHGMLKSHVISIKLFKMKRLLLLMSVFCIILSVKASDTLQMKLWLKAGPVNVHKPVFSETKNINGDTYSDKCWLESIQYDWATLGFKEGDAIPFNGVEKEVVKVDFSSDSILLRDAKEGDVMMLTGYLEANQWVKSSLKVYTNSMFQCWVDGKQVKTKSNFKTSTESIELKLDMGKHQVFFKVLTPDSIAKFHTQVEKSTAGEDLEWSFTTDASRPVNVMDVMNRNSISNLQISPSGKYVLWKRYIKKDGKSTGVYEIKELEGGNQVASWRTKEIGQVGWLPKSDVISYTARIDGKVNLFTFNVANHTEKLIASNMKDFTGYSWAPTEKYVIYQTKIDGGKPGDLKRIYGADDRLPYFRNRYYIHMVDVASGSSVQLTYGNATTSLQDIHPTEDKIVFSTSRMDYLEVPFRKQNMYVMDLKTFTVDTLWKDKRFGGSVSYSPDGSKLLVSGSPQCFENIGVNVEEGQIPNNYDTQLYIYNLETSKVDPITKEFNPAISGSYWVNENEIFLKVEEEDYTNMYRYLVKQKKFKKVDLDVDVLQSLSISNDGLKAVYSGNSISTPEKIYQLNLKNGKSIQLAYPAEQQFADVVFGDNEDWNFVNKNGTTIKGRVYYPPGYDKSKKYPVIVYYYGGTSPTSRAFDGRYPKNIWAANGYIVYVVQPSGATGFGQKFSALHVNGWGREAIDDIIDGTKGFLKAHPQADADNVGCIGASYGGFTTMLLQTRTDIFKTAVSHAGISDITSYWGEGYWGYTYSSTATTNSYPWNRKDIYVDNSPLFNADKFQNSILLLHGTSDTNVPVGESKQYYLALKLLGKDAELVLISGEDHWVIDYAKRLKWHNTIMSWFDKKLKGQDKHWNELYPEKNL